MIRVQTPYSGFTLAELLIILAILSVIAVFVIPKLLVSSTGNTYNSASKEVAQMLTVAYQNLQASGNLSSASKSTDLTQFINYPSVDTTTSVDNAPTLGTISCSSGTNTCLKLHNGGMLTMNSTESFGGTNTTNGLWFVFDPDGIASTNKSIVMYLLYNGRLTSAGQCGGSVTSSADTYACSNNVPSWFSW
jgi:Tfp pilus assembly protein FimT